MSNANSQAAIAMGMSIAPGIRAVEISLLVLGLTAIVQAIIVAVTGSVS